MTRNQISTRQETTTYEKDKGKEWYVQEHHGTGEKTCRRMKKAGRKQWARDNAIKRGAAGGSGSPLGLSWWRSGSLRSVRIRVVDVEGFRSRWSGVSEVGATKGEVIPTSFRCVSGEGGWEQVPDPTRSVVCFCARPLVPCVCLLVSTIRDRSTHLHHFIFFVYITGSATERTTSQTTFNCLSICTRQMC